MKREQVHAVIVFKDFSCWNNIDIDAESCVGLNMAALTLSRSLRKHGFDVFVSPTRDNIDIVRVIDSYKERHGFDLTHVVIFAPWLTAYDVESLVSTYININFVIVSHSNVGFLQLDPNAVELLRAYLELSKKYNNLKVGGNSPRFVYWMKAAYDRDVVLLPNMYPISHGHRRERNDCDVIKIGVFGSIRTEKNFITAVASALAIKSLLETPVEVHMSYNPDGGTKAAQAIEQLSSNVLGFTLVKHDWMYWSKFMDLVGSMDLLIQPSYTESFNLVTADGIVKGVPSVVSEAIYWAPNSWKTNSDDALLMAKVGIKLLYSKKEHNIGLNALRRHNKISLKFWEEYLLGENTNIIYEPPIEKSRTLCEWVYIQLRLFLRFLSEC